MGNLSLDLVNGVECGMSIVTMQLSAGSCLGCEKLTVEESRLKTDVRPPICFLIVRMRRGLESRRVREAVSLLSFHWDRLPECAASEPEFLLGIWEIGGDDNW
jgi:hypothetical protein